METFQFDHIMRWISFFFFGVAGVIHFGFFYYESFVLQKPGAEKKLNLSLEQYQAVKIWAKNQGYYNLFLGLGIFWGLSFVLKKQIMIAGTLTSFCALSMIGAGLVLYVTAPRLRKFALIQLVPPVLGFLFLLFHIVPFFIK